MSRIAALIFGATVAAGAAQAPTFRMSTYLGLADCDGIAAWRGDVFLACHSPDSRLPIEVLGSKLVPGMMSAYVIRLHAGTGKLIYATRIGGSDFTAAFRVKVDQQGFAYAVGLTKSPDFAVTPDAVQREFGKGDSDAFLVKISPAGQLVYATFLGGSAADQGNGLELDGKGGVLVGGTTWSSDFPGLHGPHTAPQGDAFVSYLRPADPTSLRSVVFGGRQEEKLTGLATDGRGGLFAVGYTHSVDFPVVAPVQGELRGVSDLFLTRLNLPDLAINFSTFLGGSGDDSGWGIAVDGAGNPVVSGITDSNDLPVSADAFQLSSRGRLDAFVAKLEGPGYGRVRLTYFGGAEDDSSGYDGDNIKVDAAGNVWLAGMTASRDLPMRHPVQAAHAGGDSDGFLAMFSPTLARLCFSTYRGGTGRDLLEGLDIAGGVVYATGLTFSNDLRMPARAVQRSLSPITVAGRIANAMAFALGAAESCQ